MIPIALVTGFLGSGKTTLLEHLTRRYQDRNIVWLVNEFSARDMDTSRLAGKTRDVVAIAGGSIFCRCKAAEFIEVLGSLPERYQPEAVIIEASGMADPVVAGKLLRESGLDRRYEISAVVAVVDPGSFLKLLHTLPNIRAQIEAATHVLVNKTDLHPPAILEQVEAEIRALHRDVPIHRTCQARIDWDLFEGHPALAQRGELAPCVDPHFVKFEIPLPGELDLERLRQTVATLAEDIYRIKGLARVGGALHRIDYSASGWQLEVASGETPLQQPPALVLIARGPGSEAVRRLVQEIAGSSREWRLPNPTLRFGPAEKPAT